MAQNAASSDEIHSWNPAMRPDEHGAPVAPGSRDFPANPENDASEPPILPSTSPALESPEDGPVMEASASGDAREPGDSTETTDSNHALDTQVTPEPRQPLGELQPDETTISPARVPNIGSPEAGALMEDIISGDAQQRVSKDETESSRAFDTQVTPEPSKPLDDPQTDEITTAITGADDDETSQAVAEAVAKEDGKALFNEPEQQNGTEHYSLPPAAAGGASDYLALQEQNQVSGGHDNAAYLEDRRVTEHSIVTNGEVDKAAGGFWNNAAGDSTDGEEDFFNQLKTQTKPMFSPPDPDARFEEGMPLLNDNPETPLGPTRTGKAETQIDKIFADDEDEADDFFSQVQKSEPKQPSAPRLTRKSTSQVIDSVGEVLDSPISDASPSVQQFNEMLAAPTSNNHVNKIPSEEDLAARWQAELSDNEEPQEPSEEELAARWQAELDDDDLLIGDAAGKDLTAGQQQAPVNYTPGLNGLQSFAGPSYTPHQPSTSDLVQGPPIQGVASPNPDASSYFPPQPPSRPEVIRAESFAERSKQGYKSPYDVPEGLARPRRPAKPVIAAPPMAPATNVPPTNMPPPTGNLPPPRSSSIPAPLTASPVPPPPPMGMSPQIGAPRPATTAAPNTFYEELPLPPPKPRSRPTSSGKYNPNPSTTTAPPAELSHPPLPPASPYANVPLSSQLPSEPQSQPPLQPPERLDPYVNSLAPAPPAAPTASRYSPKPPSLQPGMKPPSSPRYSPAPPPASGPRNTRYAAQPPTPGQGTTLPFQPRTSSPLAYHEKVSYQPEPERRPSLEPAAALSPPSHYQPRPSLEQSPQIPGPPEDAGHPGFANVEPPKAMPPPVNQHMSPPRGPYAPPAYVNGVTSPIAVQNEASTFPVIEAPDVGDSQFVPPRRSQTQSPSHQMLSPKLSVPSLDPFQRPASVHGLGSPTKTASPYAPIQSSTSNRIAAEPLAFIPPTDGQEMDPLERWKGAPIVNFGFGGAITSCFPGHIPRYAAGHAAPMIKSTPGEVKVRQLNDWIPPVEGLVAHPGPLKSKSKKKDVLLWLSGKIAAFENEGIPAAAGMLPDSHKRHDEKILLWKIIRVLVENDGLLEGSIDIQKSLRGVISPHLENVQPGQTYGGSFSAPLNAPSQPDSIDSRSIDALRDNLMLGDREKAVWGAVDNRLWGHAMIIASTLDKSVWKQVVQEFVRREVRSTSGNTESLAALYEIFAGNVEESIDELVPPSARAGLQMVSKVNGQEPSKNALDGLDSWRDTLGLVLSNRSTEDYQSLLALGRLLLSYGRVEAAHICMVFSRVTAFGGADDPQAGIVLLGADHQHFPSTFMHDEDAILLTEVYEFATSVLAASPQPALPHLMGFKLQHAWSLTERGRKSEAQQYCDAIAASLKATTRPSVYHHQHLFTAVDELSARLRQTTSDGSSSWISRPSMEKVSGTMWARFNSFVAGEDSDAASSASGKPADADIGPFANVTGTPTISRSPSMSDIYGSYPAAGAQAIPGPASRYQPSSQYAPNSSPEQFRGRSSLDAQRPAFGFPFGRRGSHEPSTPGDNNHFHPGGGSSFNSPLVGYQSTPPQTSYMPLAPVEEDRPPKAQPPSFAPMQSPSVNGSPYQPSMYTPETYSQPFGNQGPADQPQADNFGYMPPASTSGYGPPMEESGAPFALDEEVESEQPKTKSFDDDDDDMGARDAAAQKAEREQQDREANEAFMKAAEADANKAAPPKKSWLGSLFGGAKKEPDNTGGGPIRAKLGEQSSFYYDSELKKWVNKKDPNSATPAATAPPPPKRMGPPSRTASGASIPPAPSSMASSAGSRPTSSAGAPPLVSGSPAPPSALGMSTLGMPPPGMPRSVSTGAAASTPPGSSSGLAPPPPRPSTSLSNASSIEDLIGAPQARKGGARGKKKGRYVDVMAQ